MRKHLWVIVDSDDLVMCDFDNVPYFYTTKRYCEKDLKLWKGKMVATKVYLTRSPKGK